MCYRVSSEWTVQQIEANWRSISPWAADYSHYQCSRRQQNQALCWASFASLGDNCLPCVPNHSRFTTSKNSLLLNSHTKLWGYESTVWWCNLADCPSMVQSISPGFESRRDGWTRALLLTPQRCTRLGGKILPAYRKWSLRTKYLQANMCWPGTTGMYHSYMCKVATHMFFVMSYRITKLLISLLAHDWSDGWFMEDICRCRTDKLGDNKSNTRFLQSSWSFGWLGIESDRNNRCTKTPNDSEVSIFHSGQIEWLCNEKYPHLFHQIFQSDNSSCCVQSNLWLCLMPSIHSQYLHGGTARFTT